MMELDGGRVERLKQRNNELEALVAKWKHANDPESKWMLYLLREALEVGRLQLHRLQRECREGNKALCNTFTC